MIISINYSCAVKKKSKQKYINIYVFIIAFNCFVPGRTFMIEATDIYILINFIFIKQVAIYN